MWRSFQRLSAFGADVVVQYSATLRVLRFGQWSTGCNSALALLLISDDGVIKLSPVSSVRLLIFLVALSDHSAMLTPLSVNECAIVDALGQHFAVSEIHFRPLLLVGRADH